MNSKGNNPETWEKLLNHLDDKLQLGLLDHLKRVAAYHIEDDILLIEAGSKSDEEYLKREGVFQQLTLLAQDAIKIDKVKIRQSSS